MSRGTLDPAHSLLLSGYQALTVSGRLFQNRSPSASACFRQSLPHRAMHCGLGSSHFARRYFGNRCFFLFLRVLRCFSSPGSPRMPVPFRFHHTLAGVCPAGFPHSDIAGSSDICSSPALFAAYHVFLRLLVPRHPPCALLRLTHAAPAAFVPSVALLLGWFLVLCLDDSIQARTGFAQSV